MPEDKSESESDSLPSSNFTISNIQTGDFTIKQRLNSARRQIIVATFFLGLALLPILVRKKVRLQNILYGNRICSLRRYFLFFEKT